MLMPRPVEKETRRRSTARRARSRRPRQLELLPAVAPRRSRAGRKPKGDKAGVSHAPRPAHDHRHPVHVTLRARADAPNLRSQTILRRLVARFRRVSGATFRVVHFSVQTNHLHLIVEADDRDVLARKMTGLTTWIAREINALVKRVGRLWSDRYHRRDLGTPRAVRNALVYVLQNRRKHAFQQHGRDPGGIDAFSSAAWLVDGWRADASRALHDARRLFLRALGPPVAEHPPVAEPATWLARIGWRRAKPGALSVHELPALT